MPGPAGRPAGLRREELAELAGVSVDYIVRLADRPVMSENLEATDRAVVADLRRASARYPGDQRLAALIRSRLDGNARFAALWPDGAVGGHRSRVSSAQRRTAAFLKLLPAAARTRGIASHFGHPRAVPG